MISLPRVEMLVKSPFESKSWLSGAYGVNHCDLLHRCVVIYSSLNTKGPYNSNQYHIQHLMRMKGTYTSDSCFSLLSASSSRKSLNCSSKRPTMSFWSCESGIGLLRSVAQSGFCSPSLKI